ncbi:hypothetical protein [Campylobacter majalis]|uniref:hypothetical protein n=1 Tax=Campylobacter majalis TaxID=2790656 RepID=UPI003D6960B5
MTFEDIINEFCIQIPMIQRDYAQGRSDENAVTIREKFLTILMIINLCTWTSFTVIKRAINLSHLMDSNALQHYFYCTGILVQCIKIQTY